MARKRARSRRGRRWLKWALGLLALLLVAVGVLIAVSLHRAEPILRAVIVEKLQDRFHARVELDSFHISLVNGLLAEGKGLRIWPPAQVIGVTVPGGSNASSLNSGAPLISLDQFTFHAPLRYDRGKPIRISVVQLKGLVIDVPPKTHFTHAAKTEKQSSTQKSSMSAALLRFVVDTVECKDAHLTLETSKPGKLPTEFAIAQLKLTGVSAGGSMHFDAQLTNPKPPGTIKTSGTVGPWEIEDPGETPIAGNYSFSHADLSVFKGIAGILESTGNYTGVLRSLTVDGETQTPDFRLANFGTTLPLNTQFHATVDATNGDTWLQPVNAVLGHSHITAVGQVVRSPAVTEPNGLARPAGHDISLKVNVDHGQMEDFLRLASKSGTAFLTGDLTLKTNLDILPGTAQVQERMRLNGNFLLDNAQFTSAKFQNYVAQLSLRGQGDAKDAKQNAGADVRSTMQSNFKMADEVIALPDLKYSVPGAEIDLAGKYGLEGSTLDFSGSARMQATVSQMVGGWKGALLKPADRLFKKDGAGTEVSLQIQGTRENPQFQVGVAGLKYTHAASPAGSK